MDEIEPVGDRRADLRMAIAVASIKASLAASPISEQDLGRIVHRLANYMYSDAAENQEFVSPRQAVGLMRGA